MLQKSPSDQDDYAPLVAALGAYDVDSYDILTFTISDPKNGQITFSESNDSIPINAEHCNSASVAKKSADDRVVPCDLILPKDKVCFILFYRELKM